jgi:hypothetical protein
MPQTSLAEYVRALDNAGLLTRIRGEKRTDELPELMEQNPDTAVFVEHVKDCTSNWTALDDPVALWSEDLRSADDAHKPTGAYIMWAGTPWAHVHIMGAP